MRPRDLDRLAATTYDVLVIGGGIQGLTVAYECASRGLRCALVEAGDFGGGASFNHQKTAHGGLRALQTGHLARARESIRERRALARIAPWFLRPLPFIVGTYRSLMRGRLAIRAAFKIDEALGRRRNDGVEPELHLPAPRLVSKAATLRLFAGVRPDGLTGGAQWYDYQMVEADRLTFAFAAAADRAGADLANHASAADPIRDGGRIAGFAVRDGLTGRAFEIRARVTVNAAGACAGEIMQRMGVSQPVPLLKAMNLVTRRAARDIALAAPSRNGRMLTLVPWHGRAIVGTGQSASLVPPSDTTVSTPEVEALVRAANEAFPALDLTMADVTLVHRGVVPAQPNRQDPPDLRSEPWIRDHASEGAAGAITVIGVKYTTARAVAQRAAAAAARRLQARLSASRTAETVLPGAGIADHEALAIETTRDLRFELPLPVIRHLISLYAERAADIIRLIHQRPELQQPVAADTETLGAEIVYVIHEEMATRLADAVIRRTTLGSAGRPGQEAVAACARLAAGELGWDDARMQEEIAAVDDFYRIL